MSDRVRIITHRGHKIVSVDNSGLRPAEIVELHPIMARIAIEHRINLICSITPSLSDSSVKKSTRDHLAQASAALGRVHSACIGIRGLRKLLANAMQKEHYFASDREEALDWLVKQAE